ncbi:MAG TPA: serine hydrolase domain-containing protein [Candidatus Methylomirabilis sp.]|nr:serine hydrolase domain-containing protein [Candidatus Methylomirabilis sp.]
MEAGVADGVFPGGALLVRARGQTRHLSYHGRRSLQPPGGPVDAQTCFDLASLTKVLVTSPLVLLSIQQGRLDLETPVHRILEGYMGEGREAVRVRMLLDHSSGLAGWRPYYKDMDPPSGRIATLKGQEAIRRRVAAEVPEVRPGTRALYSDLGFILLDWILERLNGEPTDVRFSEWLGKPVGLNNLFFVDLKSPAKANRARQGRAFAATEHCPWRARTLIGEVHDENTFVMGGVSGQAGLFGTIQDVAVMAEVWLGSFLRGGAFFQPELVQQFWRKSKLPDSTRALGFDTPSPRASQAGSRFGPRTVGHLGFTGTSLWIDPDREMIVVLLTNRVHLGRQNETIKQFRPALHERVAELWS